ncbi:hypothetical protein Bca52824_065738 [Brassica carinata]|uniref:Uncharacterized protein n=1 Tax=Brassica carinata TaxID=52824 RepID=A0A8X7QK73_BRACI|nr:hypothetical protein Bca52824_065738 [Brassica carinata]
MRLQQRYCPSLWLLDSTGGCSYSPCSLFDLDGISDRSTSLPHMLPSEQAFAAGRSALGIDNKDGVVVYDGNGLFSAARGLKKADQQIILDDFNKYGPGWVYSKQGCVNKGAALGRGAATSGFNKFIELTEAAKDLKDGSLSQ